MLESGYIRLYRSLLSWEWYTDTNTKAAFLHLILTANWEPKKWKGITIKRGQRVVSYASLSSELKISVKSVRTALDHLRQTGEVAILSTHEYSVITIKNYDLYQQGADQTASEGQTPSETPGTPMGTGLEASNFQNQHNKNDEKSANEPANEPANDGQSTNPHEYFENGSNWLQEGQTKGQAKGQTSGKAGANEGQQLKKDKESNKARKIIYSEYRDAFLKCCPSFPKPEDSKNWSDGRKKRIREKNMAVEEMSAVFDRVEKSDFLSGRNGKWTHCSLDWILKSENWKKIIEGNYDNRGLNPNQHGKNLTFDIEAYERDSIYDAERGNK
jgi:hypothetical protein